MKHRAYVLGWTGHQNLGDEAFKPAFQSLWPSVEFTFRDRLNPDVNRFDSLWVGGGSFLDSEIPGVKNINVTIPICFVGISINSSIKPSNKLLLDRAKVVVVRDEQSLDHCPRALVAPDLAFAVKSDPCHMLVAKPKQITVLLNDFVSPVNDDEEWKTLAYLWFINQLSESLNILAEQDYMIHLIPMCIGGIDDRRIAAAVYGRIARKDKVVWYLREVTEQELKAQISLSDLVVTQRFHGMVFSTICGVPFISIRSHDKMKYLAQQMKWEGDLDYYGFNRLQFEQAREAVSKVNRKNLLDFARDCAVSWICTSDIVTKELSL
jgi:polysaccharide pyruvyl transferase WcaK-like protein